MASTKFINGSGVYRIPQDIDHPGLQPKKDSVKTCCGHQLHEFFIVSQVHRCLR
jgi:hypothetical protein